METSNPQNVGASPTGSETILVVEDEDPVRTLLAGLMTNAGYKVLTAAPPVEALEMVKRNTGSIDLLLTDVVMPQLSGPDLADRLRTSKPGLRVLCMSGYPADLIARRGESSRAHTWQTSRGGSKRFIRSTAIVSVTRGRRR